MSVDLIGTETVEAYFGTSPVAARIGILSAAALLAVPNTFSGVAIGILAHVAFTLVLRSELVAGSVHWRAVAEFSVPLAWISLSVNQIGTFVLQALLLGRVEAALLNAAGRSTGGGAKVTVTDIVDPSALEGIVAGSVCVRTHSVFTVRGRSPVAAVE